MGTTICVGGSMIFLGAALLFGLLKGKAAILIAGFNTMPKEQREQARIFKMQQISFLYSWEIIGTIRKLAAKCIRDFLYEKRGIRES